MTVPPTPPRMPRIQPSPPLWDGWDEQASGQFARRRPQKQGREEVAGVDTGSGHREAGEEERGSEAHG